MAASRRLGSYSLLSLDLEFAAPRTPGALGMRDAGDPTIPASLGDTPGSLGVRDHAEPRLVPPFLAPDFQESEDFKQFERQALDQQIANAKRMGRVLSPGVPDNELEVVEGKHKLRKDAAKKCREMLAQARADLDAEKKALAKKSKEDREKDAKAAKAKGEVAVSDIKGLGVSSAYRDVKRDAQIWKSAFLKYYRQTHYDRFWLKGGVHGGAAVKLQAKYTGKRKAAPGFSNHSNGLAVDLWTQEGKQLVQAETGAKKGDLDRVNARWKKAWFHQWLVTNAKTYGFYPIATEAWHWEFHGISEETAEA